MSATIFHLSPHRPSAPDAVPAPARSREPEARLSIRGILRWIARAQRRRRSRVSIADLNDAMLQDIGVTRADAEYEANKSFWRE